MLLEFSLPQELLHGGVVIWLIIALALLCYGLLLDGIYLCLFQPSKRWLEVWLRPLQILISTLPLLGLLGTIIGLLDIFAAISRSENQSMSEGIAKALLTTQMGLLMAIPALLLLWYLQRQSRRFVASEVEHAS